MFCSKNNLLVSVDQKGIMRRSEYKTVFVDDYVFVLEESIEIN